MISISHFANTTINFNSSVVPISIFQSVGILSLVNSVWRNLEIEFFTL